MADRFFDEMRVLAVHPRGAGSHALRGRIDLHALVVAAAAACASHQPLDAMRDLLDTLLTALMAVRHADLERAVVEMGSAGRTHALVARVRTAAVVAAAIGNGRGLRHADGRPAVEAEGAARRAGAAAVVPAALVGQVGGRVAEPDVIHTDVRTAIHAAVSMLAAVPRRTDVRITAEDGCEARDAAAVKAAEPRLAIAGASALGSPVGHADLNRAVVAGGAARDAAADRAGRADRYGGVAGRQAGTREGPADRDRRGTDPVHKLVR